MFINFWYVAAESKSLADEPLHLTMLGQEFVLFRDSKGIARCLSNVCTHRGGSLAHGKIKGDCIECPYHGWQFNADGYCTHIPSIGKDAKIPGRAKVDAYPTQEKYGLVFAFLGDLPEEERPPIVDVSEWGQDGWRATCGVFEWDFNYQRSIENGIDPGHNEFTHSTHISVTEGKNWTIPDIDFKSNEWGGEASFSLPGQALKDEKWRQESGKSQPGRVDMLMAYHGISTLKTHIDLTEEFHSHQYLFDTPIDENHTRITLLSMRNFLLDPADDDRCNERSWFVAVEDRVVLEPLRPVQPPALNNREVFVPADAPIAHYRKRVAEWQAKGWRIDSEEVERNSLKVAYAIPSPARREHKGWVLDAIPLIEAESEVALPRISVV